MFVKSSNNNLNYIWFRDGLKKGKVPYVISNPRIQPWSAKGYLQKVIRLVSLRLTLNVSMDMLMVLYHCKDSSQQ